MEYSPYKEQLSEKDTFWLVFKNIPKEKDSSTKSKDDKITQKKSIFQNDISSLTKNVHPLSITPSIKESDSSSDSNINFWQTLIGTTIEEGLVNNPIAKYFNGSIKDSFDRNGYLSLELIK